MNEVLTQSVAEAGYGSDITADSDQETKNHGDPATNSSNEKVKKMWERDDITPLVMLHANELVICPWMGGAEVALSEAMRSYPSWDLVSEQNQDMVIATVLELLASRRQASEQDEEVNLEEESESEEKEIAKTEKDNHKSDTKTQHKKDHKNSSLDNVNGQSRKETKGFKHLDLPVSRTEKISEPKAGRPVAAQTAARSSNTSANTASRNSTDTPEALMVTGSTFGSLAPESVINEIHQEFTATAPPTEIKLSGTMPVIKSEAAPSRQIPTVEIAAADAAADPIVEVKLAPDKPQLASDQETESLTLAAAMEATVEPEPAGPLPLDQTASPISYGIAEINNEKIEAAEDEPSLATLEHQMDTISITNFIEEEVLQLNHHQEPGQEPIELYMISDTLTLEVVRGSEEIGEEASILELANESNLSGQMEIPSQEQLVKTSLTIEEVEACLVQLTECINAGGLEMTKEVNEILDKIIELPASLESHDDENIITEAEAQEDLEELFTNLLDKAGIGNTAELIESLVYLNLNWNLADEIENLKNEKETDKIPQDRGTHEIIKKLLVCLSTIKKAMTHAAAIGRSALQLASYA